MHILHTQKGGDKTELDKVAGVVSSRYIQRKSLFSISFNFPFFYPYIFYFLFGVEVMLCVKKNNGLCGILKFNPNRYIFLIPRGQCTDEKRTLSSLKNFHAGLISTSM